MLASLQTDFISIENETYFKVKQRPDTLQGEKKGYLLIEKIKNREKKMRGSEIDLMLRKVQKYGGVLAFDQLKHLKPGKMYVVNTKPSTHPGEHWLVLDLTRQRPYLFDSFGNPPKFYNLSAMKHWKRHLQDPNGDTCGVYCIYYIVHRSKHFSPERMFKDFSRNRKENDRRVLKWLGKWSRTLSRKN